MNSAPRWILILLMAVSPLGLTGCSDDEEESTTPTTNEPECSVNADCAAGFFCSDGSCIEACLSSSDCAEGEICVEGVCEEDLSCTPGSCDDGLFCDDDMTCKPLDTICAEAGTCQCHVVNGLGGLMAEERPRLVATPGTTMNIQAVLLLREYRPLADAPFGVSVSGTGFTVDGTVLEAADLAGESTVTVSYGSNVTCELDVVNLGTVSVADGIRVYVYDDRTFEPVEGARVIMDVNNDGLNDGTAADTNTKGVTTSDGLPGETYAVTVMAEGFHYTSVAGLSTANARDIAIPLTAKPAGGYGSGFSGRIDFEAFEAARGITREALVKLGLTSASMPIKEILNFNMDLMLGDWPQTNCQNQPEHPDCHLIEISGIQGQFHTTLPGGLSLAISGEPVKGHFDVSTLPGRRYAWGIGTEIEGADLIPMVGLFGKYLTDCDCNNTYNTCDEGDGGDLCDCDLDCGLDVDLGTVYDSLIPLLADVGIGFRGNIRQPDRPSTSWEDHRTEDYEARTTHPDYPRLDDGTGAGMMLIDHMLTHFDAVTMPELPADPFVSDQTMEAVLAITGVESSGFGFIPTGLGLGFDCTAENCTDRTSAAYDNRVNGGVICDNALDEEDNTCTDAILAHAPEGVLPDGQLGVFHSSGLSAMQGENTLKRTLFLAVPMNELVRDFGTIRLSGLVHDGDASLSGALDERSFPTEYGVGNTIQRRTYTPTSTSALNYIRFSNSDDTRWHVYTMGDQSFTAPFVPEGWPDPVNPGQGRSVIGVNHMSLELESASLEELVTNDGTTLDRVFRKVVSLTMVSQAIPAN